MKKGDLKNYFIASITQGKKIPTQNRIQQEIDHYIATNGEIGGWGEPMMDSIGVDIICSYLEDQSYTITDEVRKKVTELLINKR